MKVLIWGTGDMTSRYLALQEIEEDDILGFIESRRTKDTFHGKRVYEPQEIGAAGSYDYIVVCIKNAGREIRQTCLETDIDIRNVILMDNWEWLDGRVIEEDPPACCRKIIDNPFAIQEILPRFYEKYLKEKDVQAGRYMTISRNGYDLCETDAPMLSEEFNTLQYQTDYFRYRTFELIANEIIRSKVAGATAEVGVFKGAFSKLINRKFKDKKLYLFDTFESFDEEEFHYELEQGRVPAEFLKGFAKTNVETVLKDMPYPDRCIVRKGLFPETAEDLEDERYAFVSIDVDFEKSILEGLRYFYPRLNNGGAIFVHDYNNRFLEGVKIAVNTYESEVGKLLSKVPLADEGGTLVVVK